MKKITKEQKKNDRINSYLWTVVIFNKVQIWILKFWYGDFWCSSDDITSSSYNIASSCDYTFGDDYTSSNDISRPTLTTLCTSFKNISFWVLKPYLTLTYLARTHLFNPHLIRLHPTHPFSTRPPNKWSLKSSYVVDVDI